MRGVFVSLCVALGVGCWSSSVAADESARTVWYFKASYESGQYSESVDSTSAGPILMWTGSSWQCKRIAASLTKGGYLMAGYTCTRGGAYVNVLAICAATSDDADRAQAGVGDENGWVRLTARCETSVPKKTPAKSADKNL